MAETESKEVFRPGNRALASDQHDTLVAAVKELNDWYALGPTNAEYEALSQEEKRRLLDAMNVAPKTFTLDEFQEDLICSGGLELHHGRCAPRF